MFCWPRIIIYQYSETNVMHFLFNLLRIKGIYMFQALRAHLQEALNKLHLGYCVRVMSDSCIGIGVKLVSGDTSSTPITMQPIVV
jgi:hydrogenase maturation factor